ncbi:hypothetical protein [Nocardia aurea]|uniref:hypothetical protein n=1 Tax=Nocardia aurea TaxID=2144174 RepID=UPI001300452D|nr:hypothetical protein [Nocardia aurea]
MTAQIVGLLGLAVVVINSAIGLTTDGPVRATVRRVDDPGAAAMISHTVASVVAAGSGWGVVAANLALVVAGHRPRPVTDACPRRRLRDRRPAHAGLAGER